MADAHAQGRADHADRRRRPARLVGRQGHHRAPGARDRRRVHRRCPRSTRGSTATTLTRTLHPQVDIGIAVDTDDGLFVPALRNADMLDARRHARRRSTACARRSRTAASRPSELQRLHDLAVELRHVRRPLRDAGGGAAVRGDRRAPASCRHDVVAGDRRLRSRTACMPLSLTFDHRACTGGEAARFLKALLDDLALPHT